jgi:predicted AlkP superfamily pyrophosphatase or phosphodiesterase
LAKLKTFLRLSLQRNTLQVLSVTQKLKGGGYLDAAGTPSAMVASALDDVDSALGSLYNGLRAANILNTTAFIVTAKHGQAPIDPTLLKKIDSANLTNAIAALAPGEPAQVAFSLVPQLINHILSYIAYLKLSYIVSIGRTGYILDS